MLTAPPLVGRYAAMSKALQAFINWLDSGNSLLNAHAMGETPVLPNISPSAPEMGHSALY